MNVAVQPSPRAQAAAILYHRRGVRRECETLRGFMRHGWSTVEPGRPLVEGWAIHAIADHLQAVADRQIRRLLINVPPGMSKSITSGVFLPAFNWTREPWRRFIGTSHKMDLATRDNRKCRQLLESEWYQQYWGDRWEFSRDQNQKTKIENTDGGFREAMAFGSMTGSRGDDVLLDDPLSVDDARSPTIIQQTAETFTEALPSRLVDPKMSSIIVVMQRLHEEDPSGIIIAKELGYEHLMLPMEFEPDRACRTSIGFTDPRTRDGELLFPERFPREVVDRDKKVMMAMGGSYAVAGQFQQRPVPRGGALFQRGWFRTVAAVPAGCRWCRAWDLAATEDDPNAAYTAGVLIGKTPDDTYIIAHSIREQVSPAVARRMMRTTAAADKRQFKRVRISGPQDPGQAGKSQAQEIAAEMAGYDYHFSPETGSKIVRAEPLAAQAEAGNVMILEGEWNNMFLDELCSFPMGRYADQVDAASRAFSELTSPKKKAGIAVPRRLQSR